jgi:hypothetical protein
MWSHVDLARADARRFGFLKQLPRWMTLSAPAKSFT